MYVTEVEIDKGDKWLNQNVNLQYSSQNDSLEWTEHHRFIIGVQIFVCPQ